MAEDNMQEHLNSALYGPPQTKPDERRKYMGSLRERVALCISNQELADPKRHHQVAPFLKDFHDRNYKALLNGKLDVSIVTVTRRSMVMNSVTQTDLRANLPR